MAWIKTMTWTDIAVMISFVSLIITLYNQFLNIKHNRVNLEKTRFSSNVVAERNKWLELIRQDISKYIGLTKYWMEQSNNTTTLAERRELDILFNMIRLRLNPEEDFELMCALNGLSSAAESHDYNNVTICSNELIVLSQKMLKKEWEKVKRESIHGVELKK